MKAKRERASQSMMQMHSPCSSEQHGKATYFTANPVSKQHSSTTVKDGVFLSVSEIRKFECKNIVDACYYLEHIERYEK